MLALLIVLTVLVALCGIVGMLPALFAPMMLAAPGANRNLATLVLFFGVLTFPLSCLAAVVASWICYSIEADGVFWVFLLPVGNIALAALALGSLKLFYRGQFNG
jgi:hypothetical protein